MVNEPARRTRHRAPRSVAEAAPPTVDESAGTRDTVTLQWIVVAVVVAVLIGVAAYLSRDQVGQPSHGGAGAPALVMAPSTGA